MANTYAALHFHMVFNTKGAGTGNRRYATGNLNWVSTFRGLKPTATGNAPLRGGRGTMKMTPQVVEYCRRQFPALGRRVGERPAANLLLTLSRASESPSA